MELINIQLTFTDIKMVVGNIFTLFPHTPVLIVLRVRYVFFKYLPDSYF